MTSFSIRADSIQRALAPVDAVVNECKLRFDDGGLSIRSVDPANVAMVDMELGSDAFDAFDSDGAVVGVDLERLGDVLSLADSDDVVRAEIDAGQGQLDIEVGAKGLEVSIALIDPDAIRQEPDIPDLDLPGVFVLDGDALGRAVRAADLCSDHISISADNSGLHFVAEGDTDDVNLTLTKDDLLAEPNVPDNKVSSMFSLDYFQDIRGPITSDTDVSLLLGDEMPVKCNYSLGEASVTTMLAPRIQSE